MTNGNETSGGHCGTLRLGIDHIRHAYEQVAVSSLGKMEQLCRRMLEDSEAARLLQRCMFINNAHLSLPQPSLLEVITLRI